MLFRHSQSIGKENDMKALCSLLNITVGFGFYQVLYVQHQEFRVRFPKCISEITLGCAYYSRCAK